MSGTFPATAVPSAMRIRSQHQTYVSLSRSLRRQAASRGGHLWMFDLDFAPSARSSFQALWAFAIAQRGRYGTFTFVPAVLGYGMGSIGASAPLVKGASQTGRSVTTDGWVAGATMKAGDFVRFTNHTKVYMLTADMTADGSGNATMAIEPALYESPEDNEPIIVSNVDFQCSFTEDVRELSLEPGVFGTLKSVTLTEVVDG